MTTATGGMEFLALGAMRGHHSKVSNSAPIVAGLRIQTSAYGRPIPRIFGKTRVAANVLWYGDFTAIPHVTTQTTGGGGSGGKGGGGGGGSTTTETTTYTYTAAVLLLIGRGQIANVPTVWRDKDVTTLAALGFSLFTGTSGQTAFPYLTTNHPSEALNYRSLAYVAASVLDLGDSGQLLNHSFEVEGLSPFSGSIKDSNPKDVFTVVSGELGIPGAKIGDLTAVSNYCVANGIFVSPAYTEQRQGIEILGELARIANAEIVDSDGVIKVVPYSDQSATGNGATYTPSVTPIFEFNEDDFLAAAGEEPLQFEDDEASDAYNILKLKFFNRLKDYAEDVVEAQDENHIAIYGPKPMPDVITMYAIVDPAVARMVAQTELQKQLYFRQNYRFSVGPGKADLLEPMDVISLTRPSLGVTALPVRIREITEIQDGERDGWEIVARECPPGAGASALYGSETGNGYTANFNAAPGSVNTPVIIDGPGVLTEGGFELWLGISGSGAYWGGCDIWVATEASGPYRKVGQQFGRARHGVLTATFANSAADPDTTSVCSVDLTTSSGTLTGGTQRDADIHNTLAWCESELFSFRDAVLTASHRYDLKNYLRRGVLNTAVSSHATSSRFMRLDQAVFRLPYDPSLVGSPLYLKFPSFNIYGGALEDISGLPSYTYTIAGPFGAPDTPTGFAVQQIASSMNFSVDQVASVYLDRIEIRYADPGETDWNNGLPVVNILRGRTDTNGTVPPGAWRFMARAFDRAGSPSKSWAVFDFTVTPGGFIPISSTHSEPAWLGRFLENWLKNSEDLTATGWGLTGATITANQAVDRFGALTLAKLKETNANSQHYVEQTAAAGAIIDGRTVTVEVYAIAAERNWLFLGILQRDGSTVLGAFFNLSTGAIGTVGAGVTARISARLASGGYLCQISVSAGAGANDPRQRVQVASADNTFTYTGTTGSGIHAGNAGLVKGAAPREHAPTGAAALTTDHGNFLVSVSNALVPDSTAIAANITDAQLWDTFRAFPQGICTYQQPEIDKGIDQAARIWVDIVSTLGPGVTSGTSNPKSMIDYKLAAGAYDGFETWTIGTANFRQLKSEVVLDTSVGIARITAMNTVIDNQAREEVGTYTTPGGGSVAVSFASAFHLSPTVHVSAQGSGDVTASKTSVTTTGFTGQFKSGGVAAAGTADWTAIGV
jgi:hypothetical protein